MNIGGCALQITIDNLYELQQAAILKIHIQFEEDLNGTFDQFLVDIYELMTKFRRHDEALDDLSIYTTQIQVKKIWDNVISGWKDLFSLAVIDASYVAYTSLSVYHNEYFLPIFKRLDKQKLNESFVTNILENLTQELYQAAANRIYTDGFTLSDRLWKLDRDSLAEIKRIIYEGAVRKHSINDVAQRLKVYLKGENGDGGQNYKALRLARTEIQTIYHEALTSIYNKIPFINKVQIKLSAGHKFEDVCDATIENGENAEGIYPVGKIKLPLHPNCMCFIKPILDGVTATTKKIRLYRNGKQLDIPLSEYQKLLGGDLSIHLEGDMFQAIQKWLD